MRGFGVSSCERERYTGRSELKLPLYNIRVLHEEKKDCDTWFSSLKTKTEKNNWTRSGRKFEQGNILRRKFVLHMNSNLF